MTHCTVAHLPPPQMPLLQTWLTMQNSPGVVQGMGPPRDCLGRLTHLAAAAGTHACTVARLETGFVDDEITIQARKACPK